VQEFLLIAFTTSIENNRQQPGPVFKPNVEISEIHKLQAIKDLVGYWHSSFLTNEAPWRRF